MSRRRGTPISLVVPLFDESARLGRCLPPILDFIAATPEGSELILVDDGSTDQTAAIVQRMLAEHADAPARLLRRPHEGKGGALTAGLLVATAPVVGFCDLDLSTPLDDVDTIFDTAERGRILVIGSRELPSSTLLRHQGRIREFLGRAYNRAVQLTVAPGILDTQCGAKAAARDVWEQILKHSAEVGFAWDVEVVGLARRLRIPVQEVGVQWSHDDRSRISIWRDGIKMLQALPRIRRAMAGVPVPETVTGVFDERNVEVIAAADAEHWWFRCKAAFVATALRRAGAKRDSWLVDLGAGAGGVTAKLGWRLDRVLAAEGSEELAEMAAHRHGLHAAVSDIRSTPIADGVAGAVCLLDVIEHMPDPDRALAEARRILAPDGVLIVTVPGHQWLWSGADEFLGHVRRYNRPDLRRALRAAGFTPTSISHVFSWLVLPAWVTRQMVSDPGGQLGLDRTSALIDATALVLQRIERVLLRWTTLPIGTSILATARLSSRPDNPRPHAGARGA
jgi:glycosyltransferase involved in cell wall biosynthesis